LQCHQALAGPFEVADIGANVAGDGGEYLLGDLKTGRAAPELL